MDISGTEKRCRSSLHISKFSENVSRYSYNDVKDGATTRSNSKKCLN